MGRYELPSDYCCARTSTDQAEYLPTAQRVRALFERRPKLEVTGDLDPTLTSLQI